MESIYDFAKRLDGRIYKEEMTTEENDLAANLGYVVVFGHSDDLTLFRGAINGEQNTQDGGQVYITADGLFEECPCNCRYAQAAKEAAAVIDVKWVKGPYVWSYETEIPHATFEIVDNQPAENLKFCQGLVFDSADLGL